MPKMSNCELSQKQRPEYQSGTRAVQFFIPKQQFQNGYVNINMGKTQSSNASFSVRSRVFFIYVRCTWVSFTSLRKASWLYTNYSWTSEQRTLVMVYSSALQDPHVTETNTRMNTLNVAFPHTWRRGVLSEANIKTTFVTTQYILTRI